MDKDKRKLLRSLLLQQNGYRCMSCDIASGMYVYKDSRDKYVELDDFMFTWAKNNDKSPFKIQLQAALLDWRLNENDIDNYTLLCQKCHGEYKAKMLKTERNYLKQLASGKKRGGLPKLSPEIMSHLGFLSNLLHDLTGQNIKPRDVYEIYLLIINLNENGNTK